MMMCLSNMPALPGEPAPLSPLAELKETLEEGEMIVLIREGENHLGKPRPQISPVKISPIRNRAIG